MPSLIFYVILTNDNFRWLINNLLPQPKFRNLMNQTESFVVSWLLISSASRFRFNFSNFLRVENIDLVVIAQTRFSRPVISRQILKKIIFCWQKLFFFLCGFIFHFKSCFTKPRTKAKRRKIGIMPELNVTWLFNRFLHDNKYWILSTVNDVATINSVAVLFRRAKSNTIDGNLNFQKTIKIKNYNLSFIYWA